MIGSITSQRDSIVRGETTARAAVESALAAAEKLNQTLNAFLEIDREGALQRADQIDASSQKSAMPLAGVPVAIKDNICVRGMQTSCGSRILGPYHPPYNATAIERGELIWHPRSTVPTSMPSSSDAVATSTFTSPSLSFFSAARRIFRARLP